MSDRILNPSKVLRTLQKTPFILGTVLSSLSPAQVSAPCSDSDSWCVLFIVCHLRDYEEVVAQRVQLMLEYEQPLLPTLDNAALVKQYAYAQQDLDVVFAALVQRRRAVIKMLEGLTPDQWLRTGRHPEQGTGTILDVALNTSLHDIDHIEQVIRCVDAAAQSLSQ